jgi:hypothetical protein
VTAYRDNRILGYEELKRFFTAVDRHLSTSSTVIVIGGAAAALYRATSTTADVDTLEAVSLELEIAIARAADETGVHVPVSASGVAQVPQDYAERLEHYFPELVSLKVLVLERHDLALSKIVRGAEHDYQQLDEVHQQTAFEFSVLLERYQREMGAVVGNPDGLRMNLLELIERLFGEAKRLIADRATRPHEDNAKKRPTR